MLSIPLLAIITVLLGVVKMCSSEKMIFCLLSLELVSSSFFFLLLSFPPFSWGSSLTLSSFLSISVMEGVLGLILLINLYRSHSGKGSWSLSILRSSQKGSSIWI